MAEKQNEMPKAVEDCHTPLAWIIPHLDGFSRGRRFTLGERIETRLLYRSHALRGNASGDAPASEVSNRWSGKGCIPTQSVGTIKLKTCLFKRIRERHITIHGA